MSVPLSMLAMPHGQAFAWPDPPEKSKPASGVRLQLYPNRSTGLSPQEIEFQNSHAEKLAKSRRNARAQLDAMRVELAWLADPSLFAHPPGIKAITSDDKPCVEVRGVVASYALRERALELAKRYSESPIRDKLMVLIGPAVPRQSLAAEDLQTKAERYLTDRLLEFSQDLKIEEVYPSGTIRIGGRVLSYEDKLAVSRSLRRLTGCMAVDNRIEVSPMSQDGELVTVITSDGETSLPGKIDEKRNGPVVLTGTGHRPGSGSIAGEEARLEAISAPKPSAPSVAPRLEKRRNDGPAISAEKVVPKTERPVTAPAPLELPVEKSKSPLEDHNPLTRPLEFPSASAKQILPGAKPVAPAAVPTTGIAVIEESPGSAGNAQEVQAVVGWGSNPPPTQFNPDGTPVAPPQNTPLFPNRPRLFFQPAATPPASQRPAAPATQRSAVRFLPSANGTIYAPENPEGGAPNAPAPAAPPPTSAASTSKPRRTGFINGLGQPSFPKPQPYLSPIDVVQSGRPGSVPVRTQPNANQPSNGQPANYGGYASQGASGQPMTYGGVNRAFGGQPYQMPGAVHLSARPDGQPGAGPESQSAAQGLYPWDQPVITDRTPRPLVEMSPRTPTRPEGINPPSALGSNGPPVQPGRPIASTTDPAPGIRRMNPPGGGFASESSGPTLGSVTIENEPSPLPASLGGAPPHGIAAPIQRGQGGQGGQGEYARKLELGGSPATPPRVGSSPAPSTGTAVIEDEGPAMPAFVPSRRSSIPLEDQKSQDKNNRLLQGTPAAPPIATTLPKPRLGPAPGEQPSSSTGSMTLGTIELEKDAFNRPLPTAQSLTDLAKKTCGSLISDIKTRKDGNALCVEIVVKDALSEDEVLKRLCNLAAFSHPAIRIEVSRGQ